MISASRCEKKIMIRLSLALHVPNPRSRHKYIQHPSNTLTFIICARFAFSFASRPAEQLARNWCKARSDRKGRFLGSQTLRRFLNLVVGDVEVASSLPPICALHIFSARQRLTFFYNATPSTGVTSSTTVSVTVACQLLNYHDIQQKNMHLHLQ